MAGWHLEIFEEDLQKLNAILLSFLKESEAKCVFLIEEGGQPITMQGVTESIDTTALSVLAAGAFASTKEIAKLIGEPEFSVLYHQGRKEHIHVSLIGDSILMIAIFDDRTTVGMIRLYARDAGREIADVFAQIKSRPAGSKKILKRINSSKMPDFFKEST